LLFSLFLSAFLSFNVNLIDYNCSIYDSKNLIRSEIMLQIVLKNYGYYQSKIDGQFGPASKLALKNFQTENGLISDGIIGKNTCNTLLDKKNVIKKDSNKVLIDTQKIQKPSEELKITQQKLKDLDLYTGSVDGINGSNTKNAIKEFQRKAGLSVDGVLGPNTLAALEKGAESYIPLNQLDSSPTVSTESPSNTISTTSALDLRNYNPSKPCVDGYVDSNGIWVTDPCFYPVFVYRFGNTAQVNSQNELNAYLGDRWSLEKEKTYNTIGPVSTINYVNGIHSPVNGLRMPSNANNLIVLGIKNDNNVNARPQSGPQDADAVFEVLVEGGMTRFINVFYESDTNYHGPIRSARPTDPTVLRPLSGVLVASGATGGLIPEIIDIGVPVITDRRPEFFRISTRSAPHNLYADTYKLKQLAISKGYKKVDNPQPLFPWGTPNYSLWSTSSYIKLKFSSQTSTTWTWNGNTYLRTYYDAYKGSSSGVPHSWINSYGNTSQINADTIIALFCEPYIHPLQLPSVKTVGEGRAIVMHNGKMLDAYWKRGSNLDPFHIVDQNGNTMYIPPGKPWISLVPSNFLPSFDN
jgi:peptidoglycan hydrolase-like protein with peptidoglycan-binding domain